MDINKEIINALKSIRSRNICIKERQDCISCIFRNDIDCSLTNCLSELIEYFERNDVIIETIDINNFSDKTLLEHQKFNDDSLIKDIIKLIIDANSKNLNYITLNYNINQRTIAYFEKKGFKVNNKDFDQRDETKVMISWNL